MLNRRWIWRLLKPSHRLSSSTRPRGCRASHRMAGLVPLSLSPASAMRPINAVSIADILDERGDSCAIRANRAVSARPHTSSKRHGLIQQLRRRDTQNIWHMSRVTPRADDIRTGRKVGNEKFGPRTDHHRGFVDENDI